METNKKFSINSTAEIKQGITKVATMRRTTVSCLVSDILHEYIKEHEEEVKQYDKVFGIDGKVRV